MTDLEQREAAKQFMLQWRDKEKKEDADYQDFWRDLLSKVFGISDTTNYIQFQKKVQVDGGTKSIDAYIPSTRVLIEHKSANKNLDKPEHHSGNIYLTPFEQADRYNNGLNYNERARWIITTNFIEIRIYNMDDRGSEPQILYLKNLKNDYKYLKLLVDHSIQEVTKEEDLSVQAGKLVGDLYTALKSQYKDPNSESTLKSLNALCVRLVFCMFADDSGIFGSYDKFYNYMHEIPAKRWHGELTRLFKILDTKEEERSGYEPDLESFPYVNGGLFTDENSEIPSFTDEIVDLILNKGCRGFNWREISPTIFGAVFESTLNPETQRKGGMHYTSVKNIHKVIDPLFLNDLKKELEACKNASTAGGKRKRLLQEFQQKLAHLTFFDPACGSGNFLTETYLSIRRLENDLIHHLHYSQSVPENQMMIDIVSDDNIGIMVSIDQFFGIEINDFAVSVAKTALWIAEAQMLSETRRATNIRKDYLPLKTNANITEGDALLIDWESVISSKNLKYIIGNPPFSGGMKMTPEKQSEKKDAIGRKINGVGEMDYVAAWYFKAARYIQNSRIKCAFVSTNSITQGQQAITVWDPLINEYNITINFAYRTFKWSSEASKAAAVHCVIIGFSLNSLTNKNKFIVDESGNKHTAQHINSYLQDAKDWFVRAISKPLFPDVPVMKFGSMPRGKAFLLTPEERLDIIEKYPLADKFIKRFYMGKEFIQGKERYCIWLLNADPSEYRKCPPIMDRITTVKQERLNSKAEATRKLSNTPTLFAQIAQPEKDYIAIPAVSSQQRRYIPIDFVSKDIIAGNKLYIIPDATIYHFGILTSEIHMNWMRLLAGRMKSDYSYSKDIVYNNFPWPNPSTSQKIRIEQTARKILDIRALFPNATLEDLYDSNAMPPELIKAHQANDRAVAMAYGFDNKTMTEISCVSNLMKLYQDFVEKK